MPTPPLSTAWVPLWPLSPVEDSPTLLYAAKLAAAGPLLTIPAGTFPSKYEAIEITAVLYQTGGDNARTPWCFRVLPLNGGDYCSGRVGNAGTSAVGMGALREGGFATVSNIYTHAVNNVRPAGHFRARIEQPSEPRQHFITWEWFCNTDVSGNAGSDFGSGRGQAIVAQTNAAQSAITGFDIFAASGPGFGIGSWIEARGIGAHTGGY